MAGNFFKYKETISYLFKSIPKKLLRYILSLIIRSIIKFLFILKIKGNKKPTSFVIFLYGGIGDVLMMQNFINNLSHNYNVTLLIDEKIKFVKFYFNNSNIILYSSRKKIETVKKIRKLDKNNTFISWSSSIEIMALFLLSRNSNYFGFLGSYNKIFYNNNIIENKNTNRYLIYKYFQKLLVNNENFNYVKKIKFQKMNFKFESNYILIHPHKTDNWGNVAVNVRVWINLINEILKKTDLKIILLGSKDEKERADLIFKKINSRHNRVYNFTGKTSFSELNYLIKNCFSIITGDTGIMHIAYQFNIRIFALFTFSDKEVYAPPKNTTVIFNKILNCQPCVSTSNDGCDNYPPVCFNNYDCSKTINSSEIFNLFYKYYIKELSK